MRIELNDQAAGCFCILAFIGLMVILGTCTSGCTTYNFYSPEEEIIHPLIKASAEEPKIEDTRKPKKKSWIPWERSIFAQGDSILSPEK